MRLKTLSLQNSGTKIPINSLGFVEFNSRLICFPLKTETLPPATHTNCFIVGKQEFIVIDAASREADEQTKLNKLIDTFIEKGFTCKEIIISHLHQDHFGGETALQKHLQAKLDGQCYLG